MGAAEAVPARPPAAARTKATVKRFIDSPLTLDRLRHGPASEVEERMQAVATVVGCLEGRVEGLAVHVHQQRRRGAAQEREPVGHADDQALAASVDALVRLQAVVTDEALEAG